MKKTALSIGTIIYLNLVNYAGAAEMPHEVKAAQAADLVTQIAVEKKQGKLQFGVEFRAWFPKIGGQETRSSQLDLTRDLGHENKKLNKINVTLFEEDKWRGDYESYSFAGNKTASLTKNFGGQDYLQGEGLHSEKKLTSWKINYLPNYQKNTDTNFSLLVGIKGYKITSSVESAGSRKTEQSYSAVVPSLGMHYEFGRQQITNYYAELSGFPSTGKGHNYDAELGFKTKISPNTAFLGGYRWLTFKAENRNDQIKLDLHGPFVQFDWKL